MKIADIIQKLEEWAPPSYQEAYDNARLIVGNPNHKINNVLVTLDCTEAIVDEAVAVGAELIIAHHPIVFKGLKSLTGKNYVERTVLKAIKSDIAIYAIHTNLDNIQTGVNAKICELIGLEGCQILAPKRDTLTKLVTFVPPSDLMKVLDNMFEAGAGNIGNYDQCSFQVEGLGTYRPNEQANPYIGTIGKLQQEKEVRVEVILPAHLKSNVIAAMQRAHPYEEVAYYLTDLSNVNQEVGAGMIGELPDEMPVEEFLTRLKSTFKLQVIKHTSFHQKSVKRIAVCGGAGSFLLANAKAAKADVFVTADFKYHEYFDAEDQVIIADIGHYESEVFTKDLICSFLREKIPNIAVNLSKTDTNPIKYF